MKQTKRQRMTKVPARPQVNPRKKGKLKKWLVPFSIQKKKPRPILKL
jgi:hypothetical protein